MILADMKQVDEYMAFAVCPEGTADSQIIAGQVADFLVTVQKIRCSFLSTIRRPDSASPRAPTGLLMCRLSWNSLAAAAIRQWRERSSALTAI